MSSHLKYTPTLLIILLILPTIDIEVECEAGCAGEGELWGAHSRFLSPVLVVQLNIQVVACTA